MSKRSGLRAMWRRTGPQFKVGVILLLIVLLAAILAQVISPHDPLEQNLRERLSPPGTPGFLLGSDQFGRDVLSRVIHGARISLIVGVASIALAAVIGGILGLIAGYAGKISDKIIGRLFDILLSFPGILLALALVAALGPSLQNIILAIAITSCPTYGRVMRASVLSIREREYVMAGRAMGGSPWYIVRKHVLPNAITPVIVAATVGVATAILAEATLSFLGVGISPPTPTWGSIIGDGKLFLDTAPWISTVAGLAIVLTVLAVTLIGDGLRDYLDPRIQKKS